MKSSQLRRNILEVLIRVEKDNGFSHLLLNQEINAKRLNLKDEALFTQIVYGTLERKITLDYYLSEFVDPRKKVETWVTILLRMSVYQMVYLDKVPDHAVIHEAVEIAKEKGHKGIQGFVNGVLRNIQRKGVADFSKVNDPLERLSIETSYPIWLVEHWVKQYGFEITEEICHATLMKKPIAVRIQPLKASRDIVMQELEKEGFEVQASELSKQGIIIRKGNILTSELFKKGMLTIQDQSSMLVGEMIKAEPGMTVLDSCSAPGGKATHIAEKMQNTGIIHAHDIHKKKAKLISEKAETLGLTIIHAEQGDARKLRERYEDASFDRILVDAPCSGLGVVGSKPEIKYEKTQEDIDRLQVIQLDILNHVAELLKSDGLMIYSTCTIEKAENEQVVEKFLKLNPNFEIDEEFFKELPESLQTSLGITGYGLQLFPQTHQTDGFFLTRLKKVN